MNAEQVRTGSSPCLGRRPKGRAVRHRTMRHLSTTRSSSQKSCDSKRPIRKRHCSSGSNQVLHVLLLQIPPRRRRQVAPKTFDGETCEGSVARHASSGSTSPQDQRRLRRGTRAQTDGDGDSKSDSRGRQPSFPTKTNAPVAARNKMDREDQTRALPSSARVGFPDLDERPVFESGRRVRPKTAATSRGETGTGDCRTKTVGIAEAKSQTRSLEVGSTK